MISEIPFTAVNNTSSANAKAEEKGMVLQSINLSVLTMMIQSTSSFSFFIPSSACFFLFLPSKPNGKVTTPTTSRRSSSSGRTTSFAIFAITGEAPVPVPPPMPAVINTIRVFSSKTALITSLFSSAALRPFSGSLPAPNFPILI